MIIINDLKVYIPTRIRRVDCEFLSAAGSTHSRNPKRIDGIHKPVREIGNDVYDRPTDLLKLGRIGAAAEDDEAEVFRGGIHVPVVANLFIEKVLKPAFQVGDCF